jgi:hypothetical protein
MQNGSKPKHNAERTLDNQDNTELLEEDVEAEWQEQDERPFVESEEADRRKQARREFEQQKTTSNLMLDESQLRHVGPKNREMTVKRPTNDAYVDYDSDDEENIYYWEIHDELENMEAEDINTEEAELILMVEASELIENFIPVQQLLSSQQIAAQGPQFGLAKPRKPPPTGAYEEEDTYTEIEDAAGSSLSTYKKRKVKSIARSRKSQKN